METIVEKLTIKLEGWQVAKTICHSLPIEAQKNFKRACVWCAFYHPHASEGEVLAEVLKRKLKNNER